MRIHTDKLDTDMRAFREARELASVGIERLTLHGSQSRARAFDFLLSGNGRTGEQYGNSGNYGATQYKAATWDEWGIFLNHLFDVDPDARVAKVYEGAEHFHWVTGDRYRTLTPADQHVRHNWLSGDAGGRSATGSYHVQSCKCGAIVRRMVHGHGWYAEIAQEFDGVV